MNGAAPGGSESTGLLAHYRKLWFYNFHRFKADNARRMREYFGTILIQEMEAHMPLAGTRVIDIGGARGEFCGILHELRGCHAVNVDPAPGEPVWKNTFAGSADALPFQDASFDVAICRGVIEHVPHDSQQKCVEELRRVLRPGGLGYILIPPWYNPHAGHRLKPFHVLPFKAAKVLRQVFFRTRIAANSRAEMGYYPVTFRRMRRLILDSGLGIAATLDTHFRLHFMTRIPLVREVLVPAIAFVVRKG